MLYCSECFIKEKDKDKCTQIKGTIICQECIFKSNIKKALVASTKCYECNSLIYDNDLKHEFEKNVSLVEYVFSTSETEKITRCNKCYKKWKKREKCLKLNKQILFFSAIILSVLWLRMSHWKTIKGLFSNYSLEFIVFVAVSVFSILILYVSVFNNWQYKLQNKKLKKSK